jgi:hypothetical protein
VARLYNDPDLEFYTESLAGLHDTFARPINLDYDLTMPGGDITPEDVKKKVGDARAKLLQVSTTLVLFSGHCTSAVNMCPMTSLFLQIVANWEQSGNGFGQCAITDKNYGHFKLHTVNGDNLASFINDKVGHRVHHLYLWYLANKMGILSNVLNVLSAKASADGDNVHTDTQRVQRKQAQGPRC